MYAIKLSSVIKHICKTVETTSLITELSPKKRLLLVGKHEPSVLGIVIIVIKLTLKHPIYPK